MKASATKSRAAGIVLIVYLVALAALVLWPHHPAAGLLQPIALAILDAFAASAATAWITLETLNDVANVILFLPLGLLATLALGARRWWLVAICGVGLSALIEVIQRLFLPHRTADLGDVISGSIGAILGALLGWAIAAAHDRTVAKRAASQQPAGQQPASREQAGRQPGSRQKRPRPMGNLDDDASGA